MKATLEFNLPEENHDFENASNGWRWKAFVYEFDQYLRTQTKYNAYSYTQEQYDQVVKVREKLYEMLNDVNLSLD